MASRKRLGYLVGVSLLALATSAATAKAATLVGLTADNKLVKIDTATMAASAPMAISGADQVVGIDVRPADGKLYGLTAGGQLVVIDHMSGKATPGSMLSQKVALGPRPVVDFNPAADRLRVIAADGQSLRINVDDGATTVDKPLNYDAADANNGKKPHGRGRRLHQLGQGRQEHRAVPCRRRHRRAGAAEPAQRRRARRPAARWAWPASATPSWTSTTRPRARTPPI